VNVASNAIRVLVAIIAVLTDARLTEGEGCLRIFEQSDWHGSRSIGRGFYSPVVTSDGIADSGGKD
jgi:hypothetical protein